MGTRLVSALILAQLASASESDGYVSRIIDALVPNPAPRAGTLRPRGFAGVAADGRSLGTLMVQPLIVARVLTRQGVSAPQALAVAERNLALIVATETQDAGRTSVQASMVTRPEIRGFVRVLTPPSCSRCVVLAGKFYRWNEGFQRHPNCLPAGAAITGPGFEAASRRWYEGELTVIRTASGKELAITGNHPVLTDAGWVPAKLLQPGDNVVCSEPGQSANAFVVPDERHVPALVEDVFRSFDVRGLRTVPTTPEDFHGDGSYGEVDIVLADSLLRYNRFVEPLGEQFLSWGAERALSLDAVRTFDQLGEIAELAAHGLMGSGSLRLPLGGTHLGGSDQPGLGAPARWDAPAGEFSLETASGYASRGRDLVGRLSGQVALDRVVHVTRREFSGHVYNLTSSEGWFTAQGITVSNCDCSHMPVTNLDQVDQSVIDPLAVIKANQVTGLSQAEKQAILDGADVFQVINSRRGMYTAGGKKLTREGTSKRGLAGSRGARVRPRPEQIFKEAGGNRERAIELLRLNGYIV